MTDEVMEMLRQLAGNPPADAVAVEQRRDDRIRTLRILIASHEVAVRRALTTMDAVARTSEGWIAILAMEVVMTHFRRKTGPGFEALHAAIKDVADEIADFS